MKILVTGGTGFLGSQLIIKLLQNGHQVVGLSRKAPTPAPCAWIESDLSQDAELERKVRDVEVIFHTASKVGMWGDAADFDRTNIQGTCNLLLAAQNAKIKYFIYTSTPSVVFGRNHLCGVDEKTPYPKKFLTHYARSKATAEQLVLKANGQGELKTTALRPHLIYGEGDPHLLPNILSAAKAKRLKIIGKGDNLIDVIYVHNAVQAHIQAMHELMNQAKNSGKAYFISQEKPVLCWEFINQLLALHAVPPIKATVPLSLAYMLGAMIELIYTLFKIKSTVPPMTRFIALQLGKSHYFNTQRARADFYYAPLFTIEESLARMTKAEVHHE